MATISISLSDEMKAYIEAQVETGAYHNSSEFVRDLIRQYQRNKTRERVDQLILEGLNSGEPREMTSQDWEQLRQRVTQSSPTKRD